MNNDLDPATVLEEAADLLLVKGRSQGTEGDHGERCVLGAIGDVVAHDPYSWTFGDLDYHPAVAALAARIDLGWSGWQRGNFGVSEDVERVYTWNDTTEDDGEVRDVLLLAAKDLRNNAQ